MRGQLAIPAADIHDLVETSIDMKTLFLISILSLPISITSAGEPLRGICMGGDQKKIFNVTKPIPEKAFTGELSPEVTYADDGITPKSIAWKSNPAPVPPVRTVIGRFHGHDIVDLTYPNTSLNEKDRKFDTKVLAFPVRTTDSSVLVPFFVITGDEMRWYEQTFCSDPGQTFHLEVCSTMKGNGVMCTRFNFTFSDNGAVIEEMSSSGRKQKTKITKFKRDGTVDSIEEVDS